MLCSNTNIQSQDSWKIADIIPVIAAYAVNNQQCVMKGAREVKLYGFVFGHYITTIHRIEAIMNELFFGQGQASFTEQNILLPQTNKTHIIIQDCAITCIKHIFQNRTQV